MVACQNDFVTCSEGPREVNRFQLNNLSVVHTACSYSNMPNEHPLSGKLNTSVPWYARAKTECGRIGSFTLWLLLIH